MSLGIVKSSCVGVRYWCVMDARVSLLSAVSLVEKCAGLSCASSGGSVSLSSLSQSVSISSSVSGSVGVVGVVCVSALACVSVPVVWYIPPWSPSVVPLHMVWLG